MITIINYGLGNVQAFANLYKRLNIPTAVATAAPDFKGATKLILPGVGAFDHAMELLDASGMRGTVDDLVLNQGMPILGVCVGMQILARSSEEGKLAGLGWIDGRVRRFDEKTLRQPARLPHMGWNDVVPKSGARPFSGVSQKTAASSLRPCRASLVRARTRFAATCATSPALVGARGSTAAPYRFRQPPRA